MGAYQNTGGKVGQRKKPGKWEFPYLQKKQLCSHSVTDFRPTILHFYIVDFRLIKVNLSTKTSHLAISLKDDRNKWEILVADDTNKDDHFAVIWFFTCCIEFFFLDCSNLTLYFRSNVNIRFLQYAALWNNNQYLIFLKSRIFISLQIHHILISLLPAPLFLPFYSIRLFPCIFSCNSFFLYWKYFFFAPWDFNITVFWSHLKNCDAMTLGGSHILKITLNQFLWTNYTKYIKWFLQ